MEEAADPFAEELREEAEAGELQDDGEDEHQRPASPSTSSRRPSCPHADDDDDFVHSPRANRARAPTERVGCDAGKDGGRGNPEWRSILGGDAVPEDGLDAYIKHTARRQHPVGALPSQARSGA